MGNMEVEVVDVKEGLLKGDVEDREDMHMKIPQGREHHYIHDGVHTLTACRCGLKQVAIAFWCQLLVCMKDIDMSQSTADPCLYFNWTEDRLTLRIPMD